MPRGNSRSLGSQFPPLRISPQGPPLRTPRRVRLNRHLSQHQGSPPSLRQPPIPIIHEQPGQRTPGWPGFSRNALASHIGHPAPSGHQPAAAGLLFVQNIQGQVYRRGIFFPQPGRMASACGSPLPALVPGCADPYLPARHHSHGDPDGCGPGMVHSNAMDWKGAGGYGLAARPAGRSVDPAPPGFCLRGGIPLLF